MKPVGQERRSLFGRIVIAIALTLLLGVGLIGSLIWAHRQDTRYRRTISEWPTVSGTVTSTERSWETTGDDDDYPTLTVRFEYMVQGVTYQGSQEFYVDDYREESKYPPGASVTVHYDRAKPSSSVVNTEHPVHWRWFNLLCWMLFCGAVLSCILIWGYWVRRK